jgi:tryptophan synthase alpha chain
VREIGFMKRIEEKFAELKSKGEKALVAYITAGYPGLETTRALIPALARAGVDLLEVGVPFSDPTADGPVIQAASQAALKNGTTLTRVLDLVGELRSEVGIPLVLFSYYNPIFSMGGATFAKRAAEAGVDGVLVVDLPAEEAGELRSQTHPAGIDIISLVAPTSGGDRIGKVVNAATGFIYYISVTGVTGTRGPELDETRKNVGTIRKLTKLPVVVGFGVSTPEQARQIGSMADGVVVGSAFVKLIGEKIGDAGMIDAVEAYAASLKAALR